MANRIAFKRRPLPADKRIVATAPVGPRTAVNWKSAASGVAWIVFSPLMFVMGAAADRTSTDLEYHIQIGLCAAWSVLGVISGIGSIAGVAWAPQLQRVLRWILYALVVVSAMAAVAVVITFLRDLVIYLRHPVS